MKPSLLFLVATILIVPTIQSTIPECIKAKINDILSEPVWNPPATITQYLYNDRTTYLISSNCCDQFITLYDESCKPICAPSGGFTGHGDGRCMNFGEQAKFIEEIWSDKRSARKSK